MNSHFWKHWKSSSNEHRSFFWEKKIEIWKILEPINLQIDLLETKEDGEHRKWFYHKAFASYSAKADKLIWIKSNSLNVEKKMYLNGSMSKNLLGKKNERKLSRIKKIFIVEYIETSLILIFSSRNKMQCSKVMKLNLN